MTETELKKEIERIKGRYTVIAAVITALGVIVSAVIGFYAVVVPLKEENDTLQLENEALVNDSRENSDIQNNVSALENKISELEETIANLRNENSNLQDQLNTVQANYASALNEISTLETENKRLGEQLSDIPVSAESSSSEDVSELSAQSEDESQDLLRVCPPYEKSGYDAPERLTVMGDSYKNAFSLESRYYTDVSFAFFNLRRQYTSLEFDAGHVDGTAMLHRSLKIELDGEEYKDPFALNPDIPLTHFTIPVSGVSQVKIYNTGSGYDNGHCKYGFVNAKLS